MCVIHCITPQAFRMTEWQEKVRTTEISSKYQDTVENILRDKANGWAHDYYRDQSTGYDVHVARAQESVRKYKGLIKGYETALIKITATIDVSKKDEKEPGFKKLSAKEVEELEAKYIELYKQKCEQMVLLDGAKASQQAYEWKQYLQRKRLILLQWLRNNFMFDGDKEYMARGVTWVEEYIGGLRETMS